MLSLMTTVKKPEGILSSALWWTLEPRVTEGFFPSSILFFLYIKIQYTYLWVYLWAPKLHKGLTGKCYGSLHTGELIGWSNSFFPSFRSMNIWIILYFTETERFNSLTLVQPNQNTTIDSEKKIQSRISVNLNWCWLIQDTSLSGTLAKGSPELSLWVYLWIRMDIIKELYYPDL